MYKFMNYFLFLFFIFILSSCTIKLNDSNDDGGGNGNNNGPPPPPTVTYPNFNDTGVSLTPLLSWTCNNYTGGIYYDVFLDTTSPPSLIAGYQPNIYYNVNTLLQANKMYYWQVKATNEYGSSSSPIVNFTTTAMGPDAVSKLKK